MRRRDCSPPCAADEDSFKILERLERPPISPTAPVCSSALQNRRSTKPRCRCQCDPHDAPSMSVGRNATRSSGAPPRIRPLGRCGVARDEGRSRRLRARSVSLLRIVRSARSQLSAAGRERSSTPCITVPPSGTDLPSSVQAAYRGHEVRLVIGSAWRRLERRATGQAAESASVRWAPTCPVADLASLAAPCGEGRAADDLKYGRCEGRVEPSDSLEVDPFTGLSLSCHRNCH